MPEIAKKPNPPPRFSFVSFGDIHLSTKTNYLVRGWIPQEGLILVYGAPKCGKTFWVLDLAMHIALNWQYCGCKVRPGKVMYIACEGAAGITARIEAIKKAKLSESADYNGIPFFLLTDGLKLVKDVNELKKAISVALNDAPPSMVIIDTLNRTLSGDENNSKDMGDYIAAADALRESLRCAVVLVHHVGHAGAHARGHSSLPAAVDAQIRITNENKVITATLELMKDGDFGQELHFALSPLEVGIDDEGDVITSCIIEPLTEQEKHQREPAQKDTAIDELKAALEEKGQSPPDKLDLEIWQKVVHIDDWREHFYDNTLFASKKPDAKRQAFNRAIKRLQESGKIGFKKDYIWLV